MSLSLRLLAIVLLASLAARGEEAAHSFAVLSLLGDRLTIVSHVSQTGTNFGSERRNIVRLTNTALDDTALLAADNALKASVPDAMSALLRVSDPALYEAQAEVIDPDQTVAALLPRIDPLVAGAHAARLILLTKLRYEAQAFIRSGNVAFGKLEGLGFYVDTNRPMSNIKTGEEYRGLVAPYAHFRVSLVDPAGGRVLSEESVHVSTILAARAGVGAWEELTAQQKLAALDGLLRQEIARAVARLLRPRD